MREITSPTSDGRCPGHCVLVADADIDNVHNPSINRKQTSSDKV